MRYGVPFGAYVTSVELDSPAMHAGLQAGDVITEFDGRQIKTIGDLVEAILDCTKDKTVRMKVEREAHGGYTDMTIKVTLK